MLKTPDSTTNFPSGLISSEQQIKTMRMTILPPICTESEFKFFARVKMLGKQPGTIKWESKNTAVATIDNLNYA